MKKFFCINFLLIITCNVFAQNVGIGTTTPNPSAMLEVASTNKGMLVPRVTTVQRIAIATPANGLLVYDIDSVSFAYHYAGSWLFLRGTNNVANNWNTNGNAGTTAANFIGTSDNTDVNFRRNNLRAGLITFNNTSFGSLSLLNNTTGAVNTAVGGTTMRSNTVGTNNTAHGFASLYSNTSGNDNTAVGVNTLLFNTTGYSNVAIGTNALNYNVSKSNLIAIGDSALYNNGIGATLGFQATANTAIGSKALYTNTAGYNNTANGFNTLANNTTGFANSAFGRSTLFNNTIGANNTAIGSAALNSNATGNDNTAVGKNSLILNTTGDNNVAVGTNTLFSNIAGLNNIAIGKDALFYNVDRNNLIAIGDSALYNNGIGASMLLNAARNIALGSKALFSNTTGGDNTAIGYKALTLNTTGILNTAIGNFSLEKNTVGDFNVAIGFDALLNNTIGESNTAVGFLALYNSATGNYNTAIGRGAGFGSNDNCITLGYQSSAGMSGSAIIGNSAATQIGGYKNWSNFSDGRFKTNVKENVVGLDFIKQLRPVTYTVDVHNLNKFIYKDKTAEYEKNLKALLDEKVNKIETGFIAQEVEAAAKKVNYNFDGVNIPKDVNQNHYSISYASFVVPLVKAVQELDDANKIYQTKIEVQEKKIATLEKELNAIKIKLGIQ